MHCGCYCVSPVACIHFSDVIFFWKSFNLSGLTICLILDGDRDRYHIEGLMESPSVDDEGDCFSPMLLNASSVNIEVYYNKAVNYTLMVTFVSFTSCYSCDLITLFSTSFCWIL